MRKFTEVLEEYLEERERQNGDYYHDRYVAERFDETEPWMCPGDLLKYFGVES